MRSRCRLDVSDVGRLDPSDVTAYRVLVRAMMPRPMFAAPFAAKRWLHFALTIAFSLLTLTLSPAPCHAERAWTVAPARACTPHERLPTEASARPDILGASDAAIVPAGVNIETASTSARDREGATPLQVTLRWHSMVVGGRRPVLASPASSRLPVPSRARARAFLMVFLN